MAEVKLRGVSKSFDGIQAVQDLSMTINDGEFVVLLGPTGAGKTTTLRLVAGLEIPNHGQIIIEDIDVTALAPSIRDVTFVFQQYSLYPHYTVFENMAFPLRAPGRNICVADIKKQVTDVAEMLRISSKLNNKVTQLSGGEMQRVSIGRALVRRPKVALMDEPLSSLDAKLREDLRVELKRIQKDLGTTILYVTHDQLEAMTLADRVGILEQGRLIQIGSPKKVYEKPQNICAARRLGSPPINLISPGTIGCEPQFNRAKTIGLRPEDIEIHLEKGLPARVISIEHLGGESVVLLKANGQHIHSFLEHELEISEGDNVFITAKTAKQIEFDEDGDAILNNTAQPRSGRNG